MVAGGWNQWIQNGNFESVDGWGCTNGSISVLNNTLTYTNNTSATSLYSNHIECGVSLPANHVFYIKSDVMTSVDCTIAYFIICSSGGNPSRYSYGRTTEYTFDALLSTTGSATALQLCMSGENVVANTFMTVRNIIIIDLTQLFGSGKEPTHVEARNYFSGINYSKYHNPTNNLSDLNYTVVSTF